MSIGTSYALWSGSSRVITAATVLDFTLTARQNHLQSLRSTSAQLKTRSDGSKWSSRGWNFPTSTNANAGSSFFRDQAVTLAGSCRVIKDFTPDQNQQSYQKLLPVRFRQTEIMQKVPTGLKEWIRIALHGSRETGWVVTCRVTSGGDDPEKRSIQIVSDEFKLRRAANISEVSQFLSENLRPTFDLANIVCHEVAHFVSRARGMDGRPFLETLSSPSKFNEPFLTSMKNRGGGVYMVATRHRESDDTVF